MVALKVPKFSGMQPTVYYDTSEPPHTAMLVPGKQTSATGYHDLLLVAGEAHDQVRRRQRHVMLFTHHNGRSILSWFYHNTTRSVLLLFLSHIKMMLWQIVCLNKPPRIQNLGYKLAK